MARKGKIKLTHWNHCLQDDGKMVGPSDMTSVSEFAADAVTACEQAERVYLACRPKSTGEAMAFINAMRAAIFAANAFLRDHPVKRKR